MELYFAVLAGAIIYLLFSLNDALVRSDFSWKVFFLQNGLPAIINVACGFVLIWFREDIVNILPITGIVAVFLGYTGQGIIKKLFKVFDSKFETYVGLNK